MKIHLLVFTITTSLLGFSGDSAQWRGPNRDGNYPDTNLLKQWPADGPKLLWQNDSLELGYGAATVDADGIYVSGSKNPSDVLIALDKTGKIRWTADIGAAFDGDYPLARCTPSLDGGHVYTISGAGHITCTNAADGSTKWSVDGYKKFSGRWGIWGTSENPLVVNDLVIYTPGGSKTTMVALNKLSGETVWQTKSLDDTSAYSSPVVFKHAGRNVIANVTANFIFGVDAANGEVLWKYSYGTLEPPDSSWSGAPHTNTITPIYKDGYIYTTSGYDHVGALFKIAEDGNSVTLAWTDKTLDSHHGGVVLVDGYLYGANWINNRSGNWCAIDWKTGKPAFETKWHTKGSIIQADGMLYCYEEKDGNIALVEASPKGFNVASSFQISQGAGPHWSHPVIDSGSLYIRHGKSLMAYDIKQAN